LWMERDKYTGADTETEKKARGKLSNPEKVYKIERDLTRQKQKCARERERETYTNTETNTDKVRDRSLCLKSVAVFQ